MACGVPEACIPCDLRLGGGALAGHFHGEVLELGEEGAELPGVVEQGAGRRRVAARRRLPLGECKFEKRLYQQED
jgi:hypothetical protein